MLLVSVTCVIMLMTVNHIEVDGMLCAPCYDPVTGDYVGPTCAPLVGTSSSSCEPVYRHCSCCVECASRLGDICHQMTPPCESHLMCVNDEGEQQHHIGMGDQFIGRCQLPVN